MGIAGLVLGIVSVIGGWIPGLNTITWLLAIIGIVLSAIAIKREKSGIAIAGLVLSIIGLVISIISLMCTVLCVSAAAAAGLGLYQ